MTNHSAQDASVAAARPAAKRTVAAFDFDGTLTSGGSVLPFLVAVRGFWPVLRAVVALSPMLLRSAVLGGSAADAAKEKLFTRLLGGLAKADSDVSRRIRLSRTSRVGGYVHAGRDLHRACRRLGVG